MPTNTMREPIIQPVPIIPKLSLIEGFKHCVVELGMDPLALLKVIRRLGKQPGRISTRDYFYYRLFDQTLSDTERVKFAGSRLERTLHRFTYDRKNYRFASDKCLFENTLHKAGFPTPQTLCLFQKKGDEAASDFPRVDTAGELARWLRVLDEAAAARIDPRNVRRMVRALEVTLVKGKPISALQKKTPPKLDINQIGITADRDYLYRKADARVDAMMENGLLEEVVRLRERGFDRQLSSMSGLGYRQLLAYLDGEYTLSEAVERVKYETHRFIRQQSNWFRQDDPNISWFDVEESGWQKRATEDILNWLGANLKKAESSAGVFV